MPTLQSAGPCPELRPFVRAYAERHFEKKDLSLEMIVPAQLEEVLNFELGVPPEVRHRVYKVLDPVWIGGAQTSFPGDMTVHPGNLSFAVFFQPGGWSRLFEIPMREITNHIYDAPLVAGARMRDLRDSLGECCTFHERVAVIEKFLVHRASRIVCQDGVEPAAAYIFRRRGIVTVPELAARAGMGLRQFERRFQQETGASPKVFARVARFQAALDAKLASPKRPWLDIAHVFGYHDQMHMIHDFEDLASHTPTKLISLLGDVRPPALAEGEM